MDTYLAVQFPSGVVCVVLAEAMLRVLANPLRRPTAATTYTLHQAAIS